MAARRRVDPEKRKGELVAAARLLFQEKGVAHCTVGDVVQAAGVAKGTFYLYFSSKDEVINAVVEQMAVEMVDAAEQAVAEPHAGAVARLVALGRTLAALADDPSSWELTQIYHRPENRAVHDRMAERLTARLVPIVERIVKDGIAEGVFTVDDPHVAAWFVLGGLHAMELAFTDRSHLAPAIAQATSLSLRALGYDGQVPDPTLRTNA